MLKKTIKNHKKWQLHKLRLIIIQHLKIDQLQ